MLRDVAVVLRRVETSWLHAGAAGSRSGLSAGEAERMFRTAAARAASRYKQETIRNVDGQISQRAAEGVTPKPDEGAGVVVVTLTVASRRPLPDVLDAADARQIRRALDEFSAMTSTDMVAMDLVWSPAAEEDRMSTAELEAIYTELKKIDEKSIAGRVVCRYCAGYFAAELLSCPHCGGAITSS
jgi:uncharacterized membrane protein